MRSSNLPFSIQVRMGRAALGWSQEQLAARAGVAGRTIKNVEAGRRKPRSASVERIVNDLTGAGAVLEADAVGLRCLDCSPDAVHMADFKPSRDAVTASAA